MSGTSTIAHSSLYKSVLAGEMEIDPELSNLSFSLSTPFYLGHEKLPGPLPPLPAWMLDTPMYSKLPMVPAPKGKIVLFTTGLCKKLHPTPDDLDFDPVAAGLFCEYQSLHDPHLKSHYTTQVTYDRLIKSGYITPDGMVKCSLKEFNGYHQYLKSVQLEKITQERKRMLLEERERLNRQRKQSIRKDVSERDRLIKDSLIKQKKVREKERKKLSRKLQSDYRKTMIRLLDQRRKKMALLQSTRQQSEEKHHNIRMTLEAEAIVKKTLIKTKRTAEEMRRKEQLKVQRKRMKEEKEMKLEEQWTRGELARAKRMMKDRIKLAQMKEEMNRGVRIREEMVARQREKQQDNLAHIRKERQKSALKKEVFIAEHLEKKVEGLYRKYTAGPKRGRGRFPPINPKLTTNMTTWNVKDKEGTSSDTTSAHKLPPIIFSEESVINRRRGGPPSVQSSGVSTGDAPVSIHEVLDSFTLVARQLVSTVFKDLRADQEFENLEWEEGNDGTWKTDGQKDLPGLERSGSPHVYIDASEVSPHASLMVANALKNALNQLEESQLTEMKVTTFEERAQSIVSKVIEGSLESLLPSSHKELVENKFAIKGVVTHLQTSEEADEPGQRSYELDDRLGEETNEAVDLSSIIKIFQEPAEGIPSITHTKASSESESEAEEEGDSVIGIVENPILMDELLHVGGPSGDTDVDEGLHVVMHKADDGHLVVEGAVLTAEHDTQTITERILSDITLERASGSLSGASSSPSGLTREEAAASSSSEDEGEEVPEDHSFIVPIYQKNLINIGGHLVESHLSAISMKPEADGKGPSKGKCAARNSFRNIFRPDMTYCQGSARMLRDTLVRDIRSRQTASLPGMDVVCEVLEQEEQDIMEKHSDEALVTMEETEGLCYLPVKKKPKPVVAEAPPNTAPDQVETKSSDTPPGDEAVLPSKTSEVGRSQSNGDPQDTLLNADATGGEDGAPSATEESPNTTKLDHTSTEQKTGIISSSKSAEEAKERALSAERRSTKHQVSAQSVDASQNLAGSDEGSSSGEDTGSRKHGSRKSKKVKSSSGISGLFSRISHVFSGTRNKSSASIPSHESSSEPASRQSSMKSVEGVTGGAFSEGAQAQDGTASGEESNLTTSGLEQGASLHHGASVHFTSKTVDPPVRKESIYASHRPQTPIPSMLNDEEDEEEEEEEIIIEGDNTEGPVRIEVEEPSSVDVATGEAGYVDTLPDDNGPTNPETPPEHHLQIKNDSNNANTDSGSKSPNLLPSIRTSQLQPPQVPSERASASSQAQGGPTQSGSQASQGSQRAMPLKVKSLSNRSLSGAQSMTITGRSLTLIGSKIAKSVTSTSEKEKRSSLGAISPRSPSSSRRGSRAGLSHHKRIGSPLKKATVSSQSANKVKSAYGSAAGLSISGCKILPNKPSKSTSYNRRSSRHQASLISATELGTQGFRSKHGSRGSMVMPRPPSGVKPSGSAQSGHRVVRPPSGTQAMSNPTLDTAKGSSSLLVNHRSSNERLLPRRASLEKENRMERLSTESVSSSRSSKEKVGKKKSSGTQPKQEESVQDQKPGAPMPKIKGSLTPRPPTHPSPSRQRSRPTSGVKKPAEDTALDAGQKMLDNDQATSED